MSFRRMVLALLIGGCQDISALDQISMQFCKTVDTLSELQMIENTRAAIIRSFAMNSGLQEISRLHISIDDAYLNASSCFGRRANRRRLDGLHVVIVKVNVTIDHRQIPSQYEDTICKSLQAIHCKITTANASDFDTESGTSSPSPIFAATTYRNTSSPSAEAVEASKSPTSISQSITTSRTFMLSFEACAHPRIWFEIALNEFFSEYYNIDDSAVDLSIARDLGAQRRCQQASDNIRKLLVAAHSDTESPNQSRNANTAEIIGYAANVSIVAEVTAHGAGCEALDHFAADMAIDDVTFSACHDTVRINAEPASAVQGANVSVSEKPVNSIFRAQPLFIIQKSRISSK